MLGRNIASMYYLVGSFLLGKLLSFIVFNFGQFTVLTSFLMF